MFLIIFLIALSILIVGGVVIFNRKQITIVTEDSIAVTVNKDGFIKRVLVAGRHILYPTERVEFVIETKIKLAKGQADGIATSDGILARIDWSGTYALRPQMVAKDGRSQKLRSLSKADKTIARNVDICLRKLVGNHLVRDLFNPTIRERLERQLSQLMIDKLKPLGIALNGVNLQTIQLPQEVAEALNKAKAIETLDGAIRQIDPTTREVVRGAYQLDEILHWDTYLPVPSRHTMKRLETVTRD